MDYDEQRKIQEIFRADREYHERRMRIKSVFVTLFYGFITVALLILLMKK